MDVFKCSKSFLIRWMTMWKHQSSKSRSTLVITYGNFNASRLLNTQQKASLSSQTCCCQQEKWSKDGQEETLIDQTANLLFRETEKWDKRRKKGSFGLIFDIDGVLVRGRHVIPSAINAVRKVMEAGIPTIFLTNGSCETEEHKARVLSTQLHTKVNKDQVILAHTPLRWMEKLHQKHVVVSGQGPISEIAKSCGFEHVSTLEQISEACPLLDVNDRRKRFHVPPNRCHDMKKTEAIIIMGEPIHWETHLQILIDLLITNGMPNNNLREIPATNIPVIAVNPDLLWMSEASNPRFGNGAFLCCLEALYRKLTGRELIYTTILGKPNLFTYKFASEVLATQAKNHHGDEAIVDRIYVIGDNIDTDIYGANIYKNFLARSKGNHMQCLEDEFCNSLITNGKVSCIESIMVNTGVSAVKRSLPQVGINHLHRDTKYEPEMAMPDYIVQDVLEAVDLVFHKEEAY